MKLSDYFENAKGRGIISTADANGHLTSAVYARPHFFDDGTIAFIMAALMSIAFLGFSGLSFQ